MNILTHILVGVVCIIITTYSLMPTVREAVDQTQRAINIAEDSQSIANQALTQRDACILELEKLNASR